MQNYCRRLNSSNSEQQGGYLPVTRSNRLVNGGGGGAMEYFEAENEI